LFCTVIFFLYTMISAAQTVPPTTKTEFINVENRISFTIYNRKSYEEEVMPKLKALESKKGAINIPVFNDILRQLDLSLQSLSNSREYKYLREVANQLYSRKHDDRYFAIAKEEVLKCKSKKNLTFDDLDVQSVINGYVFFKSSVYFTEEWYYYIVKPHFEFSLEFFDKFLPTVHLEFLDCPTYPSYYHRFTLHQYPMIYKDLEMLDQNDQSYQVSNKKLHEILDTLTSDSRQSEEKEKFISLIKKCLYEDCFMVIDISD